MPTHSTDDAVHSQDTVVREPRADTIIASPGAVGVPERIISYAQNLEDVLLWRALGSFGPGFYVDLGAGEPGADSVTKCFYDRGWRGLNVEPMAEPFERLKRGRPRDINLQLAVEDQRGRKRYFSVDGGNGLSTGVADLAAGYRDAGRTVAEVDVETDTLENICRTFVTQEILFLKVDVEGSEDRVFRGADLINYRPWVIVIESIVVDVEQVSGAAAIKSSPAWHALLDAAHYKHVYFDGINRFYVANEKAALLEAAFATPPNWFDRYVRCQEVELDELLQATSKRLAASETARLAADASCEGLAHHTRTLQAALDGVQAECADLRTQVHNIRAELASCYQQLYEDSRHMGWLSVQRQQLLARIKEMESQNLALDTRLSSMERSRSWQLMGPVRGTAERLRRVRR